MKKLRFSTFAQVLTVLLCAAMIWVGLYAVSYTHLRAHET